METSIKLSSPEEDEDLETLRLAALQSLKKKTLQNDLHQTTDQMSYLNDSPKARHKWGKFQRPQTGRHQRNGQYNGWSRNSNLITIPVVSDSNNLIEQPLEATKVNDVPKLVLPQDRYCKTEAEGVEKSNPCSSKFDRYNNSDESDSSSGDDLDIGKSDKEDGVKLDRSDSLEALMEQLENEIQGIDSNKSSEEKSPKPKKKKKISESENKITNNVKENLKPELHENRPPEVKRNNFVRKWKGGRRNNFVPPVDVMQPPLVIPFVPPPVQSFPYNSVSGGYEGVYIPPPIMYEAPPPLVPAYNPPLNIYERPLSPLSVNTDGFSANTLAPLSPRSAAFVLENRAIIERRKRMSFSRSPSPRFRRSRSPKRSSLSPPRLSKSPAPKRRSLSPSPIRKVLPPKSVSSPKKSTSIHERLGAKPPPNKGDPELKADNKKDKSKERKKPEIPNPILEARRRKFETNEMKIKEGVIRLKPKAEKEESESEVDEDALLAGDDELSLDSKIDALFSDEESDSDNEGRFKAKENTTNQKVPVLPFAKLINDVKSDVSNEFKLNEEKDRVKTSRGGNRRKRFRSRSPRKSEGSKVGRKNEGQAHSVLSNRRIEIKIKNPAKYEKSEKMSEDDSCDDGKVEGESVEEKEESVLNANECDLRAQLSRKRAERQKHPLPDVVPSRLLQNALQGVGFSKRKKKTPKNEIPEGKLPIHLRLGTTNAAPEATGKKRKQKNKGRLEQVLCFVASFLIIIISSCLKLLFDSWFLFLSCYSGDLLSLAHTNKFFAFALSFRNFIFNKKGVIQQTAVNRLHVMSINFFRSCNKTKTDNPTVIYL